MPQQPIPSWNTVPVYARWRNIDGTIAVGSWKLTSPVRITSAVDDVIVRAGTIATGTLDANGALQVDAPAVDDPDISPNGFELTLTVTFGNLSGGGTEVYTIKPLLSMTSGLNLRTVVLPATLPAPQPVLIRGVPGGLATLDADGDVVDAAGVKVIANGALAGDVAYPAGSGPILTASDGQQYRLRANPDNTVQAIPAGLVVPTQLSGFQVAARAASVRLTWSPLSSTADVDRIVVLRDGGPVATVDPAATEFFDYTATLGQAHTYAVRAENLAGAGPATGVLSATPSTSLAVIPVVPAVTLYPAAPVAGSATVVTVNARQDDAIPMTFTATATQGTVTATADPAVFTLTLPSGATGSVTVTGTATHRYGGTASKATTAAVVAAGAATVTTFQMFDPATLGAPTVSHDGSPYELGLQFSVNRPGRLSGVRFYRDTSDTATARTVRLWKHDGTLMASGTSSGESGTRWVDVSFATPVTVTGDAAEQWVVSATFQDGTYGYFPGLLAGGYSVAPFLANDPSPSELTARFAASAGTFPATGAAGTSAYAVAPIFQTVQQSLPPIDSTYYGRFSAGPSTSSTWFPLAAFNQEPDIDGAALAGLGCNVFLGLYGWPTSGNAARLAAAKAVGTTVVGGDTEAAVQYVLNHPTSATALTGYVIGEEFEWSTPTLGQTVQGYASALRTLDSTRPLYIGFTKGAAKQQPRVAFSDMQAQVDAGDILAMDYYGITDDNEGRPGIWTYGASIDSLRGLCQDRKPVWGFVEVNSPFADGAGTMPTPQQVKNATWHMLIHGARGVGYFIHRFFPPADFRSLTSGNYPAQATAVQQLNAQILSVAPALNAPEVTGKVTVTSTNTTQAAPKSPGGALTWRRGSGVPIDFTVRQPAGDTRTYVFACGGNAGATTATFTLTGITGTTVTVLGENRTIPISSGRFTDTFGSGGNDYEYHLYRIA